MESLQFLHQSKRLPHSQIHPATHIIVFCVGGSKSSTMLYIRAAPSTGISIGIGPIPAFFGGIGIGKACYTSTNSVVDTLYVLLQ